MSREYAPPPSGDIAADPELALLVVVEYSLTTLHRSLIAARPELGGNYDLADLNDTSPELWCADAIMAQARILRDCIKRYREILERRQGTLTTCDVEHF